MMFNATFNNISVISLRSVLLVEETGVPGEKDRPVASHRQTLSHNAVSGTPRHERFFFLAFSVEVLLCFVCLHLVCPMLPVFLDFPFLTTPSVFSNVYVLTH